VTVDLQKIPGSSKTFGGRTYLVVPLTSDAQRSIMLSDVEPSDFFIMR